MQRIFFFTFICLLATVGLFVYEQLKFNDGKLHVVFCDVGQGDAIFIRTPAGQTILVDGGPDDSVLSCLSKHMPFWERSLTIIELSHPHADHLNGLVYVLRRYGMSYFVTEDLRNKTQGFAVLNQEVRSKNRESKYVFAGDRITLGGDVKLHILGPTRDFLHVSSPKGIVGETKEFGNLVTTISFGNFDLLLTGDSQVEGLRQALKVSLPSIEVMQVPHHGSRFGLEKDIVGKVKPKIAVISVGAHNKYGHPAPKTLTLLQQAGIKYFRTDEDGEIEIVSDGKEFNIR